MEVLPNSAQGAKRAITSRLKQLPLAKQEARREQLRQEIADCVEYLYDLAKKAEKMGSYLEKHW